MKKICLLSFFMVLGYFAFGQHNRFDVGINSGFNSYSGSFDITGDVGKPSTHNYLYYGPYFIYNIFNSLSVKTAFYYSFENLNWTSTYAPGFKSTSGIFHEFKEYKSSITVPVLARYAFGKKRLNFFAEAGAFMNISSGHIDTYNLDNANSPSNYQSSPLTRISKGLCGGIGMKYYLIENITISAECTIYREIPAPLVRDDTGNFSQILLGIGYEFCRVKSPHAATHV